MAKYSKVEQDDVFKCICSCDLALWSIGIVSVPNIASLLETSKYQVRKHVSNLKLIGLIKNDSCMIQDEYENYPPYNGFALTNKGRKSKFFIKLDKENDEAYRQWADSK